MSLFTSTRTRRRTCVAVLLVWLFALSAGWANACLLEARGTHIDVVQAADPEAVTTTLVSAGHAGAASSHAVDSGAGKASCLKVCDDGSQTIVKLMPSFDLPAMATAPPVSTAWQLHTAALSPIGPWFDRPPPAPGLPLRTRFARLAL